MCVRIIVHNCRTRYSTKQFWSFCPPDNHHSSDAVCLDGWQKDRQRYRQANHNTSPSHQL